MLFLKEIVFLEKLKYFCSPTYMFGGIMQDGIHKNLPISKKWKPLAKACENDADYKEIAPKRFQEIIVSHLINLQPLIKKTQILFQDTQLSFLNNFEKLQTIQRHTSVSDDSLYTPFLEHLERLHFEAPNESSDKLIKEAMICTFNEESNAFKNAMSGYRPPQQLKKDYVELNRRVNEVSRNNVSFLEKCANDLVAGNKLQITQNPSPLGLDDDITFRI